MSRICIAFATVGLLLAGLAPATAGVVVTVNKSTQRLTVEVDGVQRHEWPVSTGRWGYRTPNGIYRPQRLEREWFSRKYDWSPMPHSIFFHHGYAIHGSYEIRSLGRPASHGCIRLQPKNAALLFDIVKANRANTRIVVTGERPSRSAVARRAPTETSAQRHRERTVERRTRERMSERQVRQRVTDQRVRRRSSDFNDVFVAPPRSYVSRSERYSTRNELEYRRNPSQRELRQWWYR